MPIRIAHLVPRLDEGGVERTVLELNEGMAAKGHESFVISLGGRLEGQIEAAGGTHVKLDVAAKNPLTLPRRAARLRAKLREVRPDIVHVHSRIPAWLLRLAGARRDFPVVSTVHGFNHVSFYSKAMTDADHVTAPCGALKDFLTQNYGTPADRISVIPWGVDLARFAAAADGSGMKGQIKGLFPAGGGFLAASVGRLSSRKGHDLFIRALGLAMREREDLLGAVVGGTEKTRDYQRRLEAVAREAGVGEGKLQFIDAVEDMPPVYSAIDLLVAASPKPEGFGRVALEAVAAGKPAVVARHGGFLDIVEDGKNGLLFTPGNARDLADKVVEAARIPWKNLPDSVGRFTSRRTLDAMGEVYERLAKVWRNPTGQ